MQGNRARGIALSLIFGIVLVGLISAQFAGVTSLSAGRATAGPSSAPVRAVSVAPLAVAAIPPAAAPHHTAPADALTFPRTVLIETFTGVWCIHCPAESQALYYEDLHTNHNVVAIAELHSCAFAPGQGPCLENFVPPDGTTNSRGSFYNVCGFPDVFFDGIHDVCGASNSESQMLGEYQNNIANASRYPGNVSIAQTAVLTTNFSVNAVQVHLNITSGVTGTYNLVSYLLEYIGKTNQTVGYGPHSVGDVVRMTLRNHPINLTAGTTTPVALLQNINPAWNTLNFSVVSFVQLNTTKVVQNANLVPVTSEATTVSALKTTLDSGGTTTVNVHVVNTSTGYPLAGATVALTSGGMGQFSPATGTTSSSGDFSAVYTAPHVTATQPIILTASVNATNYTADNATTTVLVNSLVPPTAVTGVVVTPGVGQVTLNWTSPSTGGIGVTYSIYQSPIQTGPYSLLTTTTSTNDVVSGLVAGSTLWFEVGAADTGGYAPNSSALAVTSVTVTPTGLPTGLGYWFAVDSQNFSSLTGANLAVFMPSHVYLYMFGAASYAWLPSQAATGTVTVGTAPLSVVLAFSPRYAVLQGTISPASATVTVDGTALTVQSGAFSWTAQAGTYTLNASASGYASQTWTVVLTPGNLTTQALTLNSTGGGRGLTSTNSGISGAEATELIAGAAVIGVVAVVAALVLMPKGGQGGGGRSGPSRPSYGRSPPPSDESP